MNEFEAANKRCWKLVRKWRCAASTLMLNEHKDYRVCSMLADELEAALKPRRVVKNWKKGQVWRDRHGFLHRVERLRRDGMALITMIKPRCDKELTQKQIPESWQLVGLKPRRVVKKGRK